MRLCLLFCFSLANGASLSSVMYLAPTYHTSQATLDTMKKQAVVHTKCAADWERKATASIKLSKNFIKLLCDAKHTIAKAACMGIVGSKGLAFMQHNSAIVLAGAWRAKVARQNLKTTRMQSDYNEAVDLLVQGGQLTPGRDEASRRLNSLFSIMSPDEKKMYATVAWSMSKSGGLPVLPELVSTSFKVLYAAISALPNGEGPNTMFRYVAVFGPSAESLEHNVADELSSEINWPETRLHFNCLYRQIRHSSGVAMACGQRIGKWLTDSVVEQNSLCARSGCGVPVHAKSLNCAQCLRCIYCSVSCGIIDSPYHMQECHFYMLRDVIRIFHHHQMTLNGLLHMLLASKCRRKGKRSAADSVEEDCFCTRCLPDQIHKLRVELK